jgi:hypothetical protein
VTVRLYSRRVLMSTANIHTSARPKESTPPHLASTYPLKRSHFAHPLRARLRALYVSATPGYVGVLVCHRRTRRSHRRDTSLPRDSPRRGYSTSSNVHDLRVDVPERRACRTENDHHVSRRRRLGSIYWPFPVAPIWSPCGHVGLRRDTAEGGARTLIKEATLIDRC